MSLRWKRGAAARAIVACAALACVALAGCGYNLVGRGSTVPPDIHSVVLKALENKTQRQQVDQILTQAIAKELVTRKRFTVVNDASGTVCPLSLRTRMFSTSLASIRYWLSAWAVTR